MKKHTCIVVLALLSFMYFGFVDGLAQKVNIIPHGKTLSFNGKFRSPESGKINTQVSENGVYNATYSIGAVSDENREILNFRFFENDQFIYSRPEIPGSEVLVSNSGIVAVFDMSLHFNQQLFVHLYNKEGNLISSESFTYASLFGFSPTGNKFVVGTEKSLQVLDLKFEQTWEIASSSQFAFSENEKYLVTAREDKLWIYNNFSLIKEMNTGLFYPRAVAVDPGNDLLAVVGKSKLKAYRISDQTLRFETEVQPHCTFRDLILDNGLVYAGVHYKKDGVSKGILNVYSIAGEFIHHEIMAKKQFKTFKNAVKPEKSNSAYNAIPWPFEPFNQVHKVWNHYEQHMGNGSGTWSYLHQGLDLEVPIAEPAYAVEEGWVKLVLTLGGDAYWRVAVSPEQSSGYSDGWLYAHLIHNSIQVDVGDYVQLHDYIGDIINWTSTWGHIHFVNIRDQGNIWYYDDDEWGINFNPLLALVPNTDEYIPVIEDFSVSSKFGYCENESSVYLDPENLSDEIDIIAKISDYHGTSEWEQPAYRTYYWVKKHPEGTVVFPKTLGQILNHTYTMYNSTYYEAYAPLMYKKDYLHPAPPWMNFDRDYYQVLTNNNGDSIAEPWETALAFNTAEYYDGSYQVFIEVWDEYGNMAIDSQVVVFINDNISGTQGISRDDGVAVFPNPANDFVYVTLKEKGKGGITLYNNQMVKIKEVDSGSNGLNTRTVKIGLHDLPASIYYIRIEFGTESTTRKIIKV